MGVFALLTHQKEAMLGLMECINLGIPTISLIDTNCDPNLSDISIPANDDAISSIRLILNKLIFAICEGQINTCNSLVSQGFDSIFLYIIFIFLYIIFDKSSYLLVFFFENQ
ncbi:unnamed protein product [Cuscuta epithymum]|uniref:Small ribosomal subunit protein uS2c n=1 Tax=Cuscuta epithymum TaxID=186058 RepID=A0AAV0E138_9ASTE|nr:unnamed protein product [Cuscuta epithymum]